MIKVIGLNIKVLKKEPFSGSHQGMRFFMRAEDDTLHVWVYPEPWKNRGCYVTLKHFCCNNQEDNRNKTNANVNERALREIYLKGFEIAVKESHPGAVMSSYNKVNGKYVNNSYRLLTQVLRNEWGFDGLVMTDWFATGRKYGDPAHAIASGNDLIMPGSSGTVDDIVKAVSKGIILEEDVKRSAANVLKGITSSRIYQGFLRKQRENGI